MNEWHVQVQQLWHEAIQSLSFILYYKVACVPTLCYVSIVLVFHAYTYMIQQVTHILTYMTQMFIAKGLLIYTYILTSHLDC